MLRSHTCGVLRAADIGTEVTLCGWVNNRRDHGGIIFIDMRDRDGLTQIVFDPKLSAEAHEMAEHIRSEWVLKIKGKVRARGADLVNPKLDTGEIEVEVYGVEVLSKAETPPFEIDGDVKNDDVRMTYRYLDLRRPKMQKNMKLRHDMVHTIRNYFNDKEFWDIETPIMVKGTPEGSREYLVPSRVHPGEFYVLPQSPQQLKQLLMVGGIDKYFQVARCFRDEDLRGDRQPEFTQYEIEMSFVEQEDVLDMIEGSFHALNKAHAKAKEVIGLENGKFPRLTWLEAMSRYGTDKPDLRFDMQLIDVTEIAKKSGFVVFEKSERIFALPVKKKDVPSHIELPDPMFSRKDVEALEAVAKQNGAGGLAWVRIGDEVGPVAKKSDPEFIKKLQEVTGTEAGDHVLFGAGSFIKAVEPLGAVRNALAEKFELADPNKFAYCWVLDFPLLDVKEDGSVGAAHHPFTAPHPDDVELLDTDPTKCRSIAYDIVLNGVELGGGSVRIHDKDLQHKMFEVLGMGEAEIQKKFGHILKAFSYGCPPHGGCAMGLDRVVMMFADEPNIREVMAFPKNHHARDLMLGAPSVLPEETLREQNIQAINLEG